MDGENRKQIVVLTRQPNDNAPLAERLIHAGVEVIERPCISIRHLAPKSEEIASLPDWQALSAIFFSSKNGVEGFFRWLKMAKNLSAFQAPKLVGAVGEKTAATLSAHGLFANLIASPATGEAMAEEAKTRLKAGDKALFIRGVTSRDTSSKCLETFGVERFSLTVYANEAVEIEPVTSHYELAVVASPLTAKRFIAYAGQAPKKGYIAIGETTRRYLSEQGLTAWMAKNTDTESLAKAVLKALA